MRKIVLCAAALAVAGIARAADEPQQLTVTIYNNDLALVQDIRHPTSRPVARVSNSRTFRRAPARRRRAARRQQDRGAARRRHPDARDLFEYPGNLRAEPTLSVTVDSAGAGGCETTLSYLTTGLSWQADYVALFDEKQSALNLQGWFTEKYVGHQFQECEDRTRRGRDQPRRRPPEQLPILSATSSAGSRHELTFTVETPDPD